MTACVIDASTVAAALFEEDHADRARWLLRCGQPLQAPDLIFVELASVIWKRHRRGEIDIDGAHYVLAGTLRLPLRTTLCTDLVAPALELALSTGRSVYDCLYVALAMRSEAPVITADKRLVNALANTPLARHVKWIGAV